MFSKSSFLCSWNLSFQWVQPQPKPRRQTSKMSPNLHAPVHLYKHTLCCVTQRSSQWPCWGKNVTRTGGMTVGNKRGPPVYLNNDLSWTGLLSHLLGVSPSCHSPTSVTVHPALPAGSGKFAFSVILRLKLKVCICRSFSYRFLQQKNVSARPTRCQDNTTLRDLLQFLSFVFIYFL